MKTFRGEIEKFRDWLKVGYPFSLSRYGDGEWSILEGRHIDILGKANGEFRYSPTDFQDELNRDVLRSSFTYKYPNYHVGISCSCCAGQNHQDMKVVSGQDDGHLTFANVFVNGNYQYFLNEIAPLLFERTVVMVGHNKGVPANLPFKGLQQYIGVGPNAWREVTQTGILDVVSLAKLHTGKVFLFAAGPLANILASACNRANPSNTYIDIGSVFDPYLFQGVGVQATRGYLAGGPTLQKTCIWG